jgi:O-antigen/teichoic acid export membrane protein
VTLARALSLAPLQLAQALVGLGAIAAFTRLMSAEEFGQYALALSASMLAHTLLFTWAEAAAFRFLPAARAQDRLKDHFATLLALALALCIAVLVATGALLMLAGFTDDLLALCAFAAGAALLRFIIRIARESDRAALHVGRYAILETAYLLIGFSVGVALLMRFDLGAAAPFAGLLLAGVVVLFVDAPRLFRQARGGAPSADRAASYAAYGAPLALALAIDLAVQTIARFMLAAQAGASEVGAYAAAFGLARPLDLLFMAAGAAISPLLLVAYENKGAGAVRDPARSGVTLMAAIVFPAAIGLAFVAVPLSTLLVGQALSAEAARALPWLALAGVASGFNLYYLSEAFQLTRRTGLRATLMLIPGAVQLALTAMLAGTHGATGAAMAAAAGAGIGSIVLILVGRRLIALPLPLDAIARVAAATAIMSISLIASANADLLLRVAIGALSYALAAFALNVAGIRTLADAGLLRLAACYLPFAEQTHAR